MRLLKNLRITLRTPPLPIISGPRAAKRHITPVGYAGIFGGLLIAFSSQLSAQEFRKPILTGDTPGLSATLLQQKIEHADALKQQMIRAQIEQGASNEFAQKAFNAQQAYLAETAYDHHLGYQEMLKAQGGNSTIADPSRGVPVSVPPANYRAVATQFQKTNNPNKSQPSKIERMGQTYTPPVHAAPQGVTMSLSDETAARTTGFEQSHLRQAGYQQAVPAKISQAYPTSNQKPAQPLYQYVAVEPSPMKQQASLERPISSYRATAMQAGGIQPDANRRLEAELTQSVSFGQQAAQAVGSPRVFPMMPKQKIHGPSDPYVLGEERPVGLQNRIERLLAKPRYQALLGKSKSVPQSPTLWEKTEGRVPSHKKRIQSALHQRNSPQESQRIARTSPTRSRSSRAESELRHAFEMEQRIQNTMQSRVNDVRQVAMTTPVQEPFKAQASPISRFPREQYDQQGKPTKQVSILKRRQEAEESFKNQFGGAPNQQELIPNQGSSSSGTGFQEPTDETLQKVNDEKARLQQLENELEAESAAQLNNGAGQSVVDEEMPSREFLTKPIEKTCAEFRNELLKGSIRDISLDISPPASSFRDQYVAVSRDWTDREGRVIATGSMVDLRRGYVIIDGENGMLKIPYAKLCDADWGAISQYWRLPEVCSVGNQGSATRNWVPQTFTWQASSLCHKPLFFENIQLERYGHSHGPITQPVRSVAHFFVSLVSVPYQSAITPANECQYALGFYRPGNCAPWLKDPIPFSLDGTRRQALVTAGIAFIP